MYGSPQRSGNWIVVPLIDEEPRVHTEIGLALGHANRPDSWSPAFLDWAFGHRVVQIKVPESLEDCSVRVWIRVNGNAADVGEVEL